MQSGNTVPNRSEIKTGKFNPKNVLEEMPDYEAHMRDKELEEFINGKEGIFRLDDIAPEDFIAQEVGEKQNRSAYGGKKLAFPDEIDRAGGNLNWPSEEPVKVEDWQLERFKVEDNEDGLFTIAKACGFGMAQHVATDDYGYKWGSEHKDDQETLFTAPVVALSPETWGYRERWGGVKDAYRETVDNEGSRYDPAGDHISHSWAHEIYLLRPGLEDGGFAIQSGSSGSTIQVVKRGDTWDVELFSPVLSGGELYEGKYADTFHEAERAYKTQRH